MTKYSTRGGSGMGWGSILLGGIIVWLLSQHSTKVARFLIVVTVAFWVILVILVVGNWDIVDSFIAGAF